MAAAARVAAVVDGASLADDLALGLELADLADAITAARFLAEDLRVDTKPDLTPVTDADRAVEESLRAALRERRPGDAVHGEEYEDSGQGPRRWVIDPIDGTKNFVRGVPVWATLIALMDGPEAVVGVVSAPGLARRWWAARGLGAWTASPGRPVAPMGVSAVADVADASLSFSSLTGWEAAGRLPALLELTRSVWRHRAYGDFWSYLLVAEGAVDVACEPEVALHDLAALVPIVEEAGGRFSALDGSPGPAGGSAVATNGLLHDAVLTALRRPDRTPAARASTLGPSSVAARSNQP